MRFRIPPHLKERVTVKRDSAYESGALITVAETVACLIVPGRDLVHLESGVSVKQSDLRSDWTVLLETPNPAISEGDFLLRADGSELKVHGVRRIGDGQVMLLEINNVTIP